MMRFREREGGAKSALSLSLSTSQLVHLTFVVRECGGVDDSQWKRGNVRWVFVYCDSIRK